ncbi:hypothetical protein LTR56_022538 [Elasticomyces elasticus]|uniref:Thioredoxin domain-containing protein n=1 Tax=Elasticomyces elasticus TaxID=574655 RepID=A0AAN7WBY3_9PEZI|nr:hypothetical protein LTR56_022538 [Elasticomyces elasticus]KAK3638953.1 hypothetical protein LTR22_017640 [Elasticomyces elasticus]KAK4895618.1 hypothetical protein LTR27_006401 [Elasticomyces elasticus]KAK4961120.1 hypothetical protein LTR10_001610 [Elasticomyces elasticus]KAK4975114.1 hypothetical protein LTR42_004324 [Elasticomyces elasticus]
MHADLNSKEDFDNAIKTEGKYVFILAYDGDAPPNADEYAKKFEGKVDSYKFDVAKAPKAKEIHGITATPCALIFKDGKLVKKVPGMQPAEMKEVGQMMMSS